MRWLSDDAVARLREAAEIPDLTATPYELVRELGRGGMGVVHEVRDTRLDRSVAMKVIDLSLSGPGDPGGAAARRIEDEARVVAALEHPGIVPLHDIGRLADGRLYYTMKLVRGTRLDEWLAQGHPRTETLRLFARICEPVAFANASGVVHRDLKPENIMVGEFGAVLVMDWGVAAAASTVDGTIVGTLGFMSPEQSRGEPAGPESDVYSLGAILGFMLRGTPVPRPLAAITRRATAAEPRQRYHDARALAEDVLGFLDEQPVSAYRENLAERSWRWIVRNRVLVALIAAYVVMRVIVFFAAKF